MSAQLLAMLLVALGLYLVVTSLPFGEARPPLAERFRRWDVDALANERRQPRPATRRLLPWQPADAIVRPLLEDAAEVLGRLLAGTGLIGTDLEGQLCLLRPGTSMVDFGATQLLLTAVLGGALIVALLAVGQPVSTALIFGLVGGVVGFVVPRARLARQGRHRQEQLVVELPQIVRLMAISRSAGLGLDAAVERVARTSVGPLGRGLQQARAQVGGGVHLIDALEELAKRENVAELSDLVSRLKATDEYGLPLVQALEDLARSAEQRAANRLLERGEKGALKALLPLGLVMLPVSVGISIVPSILVMLGKA